MKERERKSDKMALTLFDEGLFLKSLPCRQKFVHCKMFQLFVFLSSSL